MEVLTQVAQYLKEKGLLPLSPTPKPRTRAKTLLPLELPHTPAYEIEVWSSPTAPGTGSGPQQPPSST